MKYNISPDKGLITRYHSVADISLIYQADTVVVRPHARHPHEIAEASRTPPALLQRATSGVARVILPPPCLGYHLVVTPLGTT